MISFTSRRSLDRFARGGIRFCYAPDAALFQRIRPPHRRRASAGAVRPQRDPALALGRIVIDSEADMSEPKYLTPDEVAERYRGESSPGTLRNWRSLRIGPSFVKVGKGVLYPIGELEAWDRKNVVECRAGR